MQIVSVFVKAKPFFHSVLYAITIDMRKILCAIAAVMCKTDEFTRIVS